VNGTLLVNQAPATVTADNQSKTYGGTDPTLTDTVTGLVHSDPASVITGIVLSTTTGAAATAGSHAIVATGGTATNYSITDVNGTLNVAKAPLTATANNQSTTYGTGASLTYTVAGTLFYGDLASVVSGVGLATTTGAAAVVGSYPITASGGTAANYSITDFPGTLTVGKAPLTVTANNQSTTYGTNATLTYTVGGTLYYGDPASVVSGVGLATTTGPTAVVGSYPITASGGTATNYSITDFPGTLTIGQAPLTVTANNQSKTYGGADPTLTFTPSGTLFYADTYGVISGVGLSTTTGAAATAGTHPIVATGGTATNYSVADVNGTLTVAKANLTVTATNSASTTYGTAPVVSYVVGGTLYYGDTASVVTGVTLLSSFGIDPPVGTYSATPFGGVAANYNVVDVGVTNLTVTPATLFATANNQSKVYGALDPTLTFTLSGQLFYGDTYGVVSGVSTSGATGAAATVGTHPIVTTGGVASNYTIVDVNGLLTVTPATLYATANNQSKVYGAADPVLTYTPSGTLYYGDSYSVISGVGLSTTTGAAATAGTHTITATGGTSSNYAIVDGNGTLSVSKAVATVTATNESKVYGGADPALTYTVAGLVYGDSASVVSGVGLSTATGAAATAGTHPIAASGGIASNYTISDVNGLLTVTPATLTITADPQAKYAGSTFTFNNGDYTTSGLVYGDTVTGATLSSTGAPSSAAPGTYPILLTSGSVMGTGLSNYTIVYVQGPLVNIVSNYGQIPLPWIVRAEVSQTIGAEFDASYGERQFFELEVPGTISRTIPSGLLGIGVGSSLVDVRIGLETIYSLDRFQSFRH
jgi:hypothetical protein